MKYDDFINSVKYQKDYDEVISMGFNCWTSRALRRLYLQSSSYPLDWIRCIEEETHDVLGVRRRLEVICSGFQDFFNESDLYIGDDEIEDPIKQPHRVVLNRFNGMCFFHDFPKGKTIAESYPEIKAKYDRRIKRFMDLLNSGKKICFVVYAGLGKLPEAMVKYPISIFYKIFPNANVDFVILQNDLEIGDGIIYEEISDKIRRVYFYNGPYDNSFQGEYSKICLKLKHVINALVAKKEKNIRLSDLAGKCFDGKIVTNPVHDYKGFLSFGPYTVLSANDYNIIVDYELTENYDVFVDVCCNCGKNILFSQTALPHNQKQFNFDLHLDNLVSDLEVRFFGKPKDFEDKNNKFKLFGIKIIKG